MASSVPVLQSTITDEVFKALGLPADGWLRRRLGGLFARPTLGFAQMAVDFEATAEAEGFPAAARALLPRFVRRVITRGEDAIPRQGPLLIASNHPGTIDSVILAAKADRKDLKIIASGGRFLRSLPLLSKNLIHVSLEPNERVLALRHALRHLCQGGALLLFPTGTIDPDPELLPGAERELEHWSASLQILCERVPEVQVVVSIVSGVLARRWFEHPIARLYKDRFTRQRVAEFFQVMQVMVSPGTLLLTPRVSFSSSLTVEEIASAPGGGGLLPKLVGQARGLLREHLGELGTGEAEINPALVRI